MKFYATTLVAATAAALFTMVSASAEVVCTQSGPDQPEVCQLSTPDGTDTLPCIEIVFKDNTCHFDSKDSSFLKAHSDCRCSGNSFADWLRCQQCLLDHGFQRESGRFWNKVLYLAAKAICNNIPANAIVPALPTSAQTATAVPALITPSNDGDVNQLSPEADEEMFHPAAATQIPYVVNQTAAAVTAAPEPQKTCVDEAAPVAEEITDMHSEPAEASPTDSLAPTTTVIIPIDAVDSFSSVDNSAPPAPTGDASLLPPGVPETNAGSSFGRSGLAMAIAGGIIMGVL